MGRSIKNAILMNEAIFFPLLIAGIILLVSIVEHRTKLQQMAVLLRRVNMRTILPEVASWSIFAVISLYAYSEMSEGDPSVLVTMGAALAFFACCLVWVGRCKDGCLYLSPAFLGLQASAILIRLTTTTRYQAYLPVDATGDWLYQSLEGMVALGCLGGIMMWSNKQEVMPVTEKTWTVAALGGVSVIAFASQCYGDLASRPQADMSFAASVYLELFAWCFQMKVVSELPRHKVNAHFLAPLMMSNMCRAYFWHLAYPEVAPIEPVALMSYFPEVLCWTMYLLCGQTLCLMIACLLKIPVPEAEVNHAKPVVQANVEGLETIQEAAEEEEEEAADEKPVQKIETPSAPVAPVTWNLASGAVTGTTGTNAFRETKEPAIWNLASGAVHEPRRTVTAEQELSQRLKPAQKEQFPELRAPCYPVYNEPLPEGMTRFVPTKFVVENGLLCVDYIPA